MEATKNHWLAAIREAQREQSRRIRDTLGQGVARTGELIEERKAAIVENKDALLSQGARTVAGAGTAFVVGAARGYAGDDALKLGPVPAELLLGLGAHIASGLLLTGTPAAAVAHGMADALIAASAVQLGRSVGAGWRERVAAQRAPQQGAAAGYAPQVVYALPPGYAPGHPVALPAYAGAGAHAADRAMAEAIAVMQQEEQLAA